MDNDPFAGKFGQWILKCTSYWQSIFRVGIPAILVVRGIDYVQFRMAARKAGAKYPYPFPSEFIVDVCILLAPEPGTAIVGPSPAARANGQLGGLPEVQFPNGTGPGTVGPPKPIPPN